MPLSNKNLAESILAGMDKPFGLNGYFLPNEWMGAAQDALDTDEWDGFKWMLAREMAWDEFVHSSYNAAEWDFDDYCDRYAHEAARNWSF